MFTSGKYNILIHSTKNRITNCMIQAAAGRCLGYPEIGPAH